MNKNSMHKNETNKNSISVTFYFTSVVSTVLSLLFLCRLDGCYVTKNSCEVLCFALQSANCPLKQLNVSNNNLQDSGVELFSAGLKNSHCTLEALKRIFCQCIP